MNFNELKTILTGKLARNISYTEIAAALGVSKQYITQIKKKELNGEQITKLEKYFNCAILELPSEDEDCFEIPIKGDVIASMGYGVRIYNENATASYSVSKKLINDLKINPNNTEMIFAQGDSMMPTIEGGDSLLVDYSKTDIYDGKVYCVRIDGQLYAKRLQKIPPHTVRVVSDNPKYRCFEIDLDKSIDFDFRVIGEIRWWGRVAK